METSCPSCGSPVIHALPGTATCPRCGASVTVDAEGFDWETGVHLDDQSAPESGATNVNDESDATGVPDAVTAVTFDENGIPYAVPVEDAPSAAPSGPLCEVCGARPAVQACPTCQRLSCAECMRPAAEGGTVCRDCALGPGVEFDGVKSATFFQLLWPTIQGAAFRPSNFFSRLRLGGSIWPALLFGVAAGIPGGIVEQLSSFLFQDSIVDLLANVDIKMSSDILQGMQQGMQSSSPLVGTLAAILFLPVTIGIGLMISSVITHGVLMMFGGANAKLEDTIRVFGYGNVTSLAKIVPGLGTLASYIWNVVVVSIGLSKIHRISPWKAAAAMVLPQFLCCCSIVSLVGVIAGVVAGSDTFQL